MTHEEWLVWRRGGFGGSDAAGVMGEKEAFSSPIELVLEKTGRTVGRVRQPWEWKAMQRGIRLEPEARRSYESMTGIQMPPDCLVHPKYPQLRLTADGVNYDVARALEIKCPGKADHKVAQKGEIPAKYVWQCVHTLMVLDLDFIDYFSYREDADPVLLTMKRDFKLENRLMDAELSLWKIIKKYLVVQDFSNVIQFKGVKNANRN